MSSRVSIPRSDCFRSSAVFLLNEPATQESNFSMSSASVSGSAEDPRTSLIVRATDRPSARSTVTVSGSNPPLGGPGNSGSASMWIRDKRALTGSCKTAVGVKSPTTTSPFNSATARQYSKLNLASSSSAGFGNLSTSMFLAGIVAVIPMTSSGTRS